MYDGPQTICAEEVLFVPGISKNLLSVAALDRKGLSVKLSRERVTSEGPDGGIYAEGVLDPNKGLYKMLIEQGVNRQYHITTNEKGHTLGIGVSDTCIRTPSGNSPHQWERQMVYAQNVKWQKGINNHSKGRDSVVPTLTTRCMQTYGVMPTLSEW